jgi:hypothetical protein
MARNKVTSTTYDKILVFIREYQRTHWGESPTRKEIAEALDISHAKAQTCVEVLAIRGKLKIQLWKKRGIELVEEAGD